jgi:pyruvate kinase
VVRECDGLMVARGDLGMEIPLQKTIIAQKFMIKTCLEHAKFAITATQMMDSMEKKPRPTRAETSDITNAVLDLTDATMLSGETTTGQYPVECVKYMNWIAQEAQLIQDYQFIFEQRAAHAGVTCPSELQVMKAVRASFDNHSHFIVCRTESSLLPRLLAKWRPACHIYAACPNDVIARSLTPVYAVRPFVATGSDSEIFTAAQKLASEELGHHHPEGVAVLTGKDDLAVGSKII